jgi:hypothetical protein
MSIYRNVDAEEWFTEMMQRTPPLTLAGVEEMLNFIFTNPDSKTLREVVTGIVLKWRVNRDRRILGFADLSVYSRKWKVPEGILVSPSPIRKQPRQEVIEFGR